MKLSKSKEEVVAGLHTQIDQASARIDELKVKAKLAELDAKVAVEKRIAQLEHQRNELSADVRRLKDSSGEAWQDLARGCQDSWKAFSDAVSRAVGEFKS